MNTKTPEAVASNAELGLLSQLRSLKVLLGTDSPEVRGWAPAIQRGAQATVNAALVAAERKALRAAQSSAVMPLIGPLLDVWQCCSQSVREEHPELDKQLRLINRAMEEAEAPNQLSDSPERNKGHGSR